MSSSISPEEKDTLVAIFDDQNVLKRGDGEYLDIPFFSHSQATQPKIVKVVVDVMCRLIDFNNATKIVSEEEYGGFLAVCIAMEKDIPFSLAKQDKVHAINGISVNFSMAYNNEMSLHINGVDKSDRVIIIDDIVDSGGTMTALIQALQKSEVKIEGVFALAEKVNKHGVEKIRKETGYSVTTLIQIDTTSKKSKVVSTLFD